MTTPKHRIMRSGPDLEKGLRELKEAGVKVLSFERVGRTIIYKCMAKKKLFTEAEEKAIIEHVKKV